MASFDVTQKIERKKFIVQRLSENPLFVDWMKLKYVIETGQQIEKMIDYESHFLKQLEKQKIDFDRINTQKNTMSQYDDEITRQRKLMAIERQKREVYNQYHQQAQDYDDQMQQQGYAGDSANVDDDDEYQVDNIGMMGTDALEPKPKNLQYAGRDQREQMMQQPKIHNPYAQQHDAELQAQQQAVNNLRMAQQQGQFQPRQPIPPHLQRQPVMQRAGQQQQFQPQQQQMHSQMRPPQPSEYNQQMVRPMAQQNMKQPIQEPLEYDQTDYGDMSPEQKAQRIVQSTGNEIDQELMNDEDISFDGLPEFEDDK
jgi:hypothetical protein